MNVIVRKWLLILIVCISVPSSIVAQPVPNLVENIPHLVIFGKNADGHWGDFYHVQVFFFQIPKEYKKPFYIRVFDPDCGGAIDEINGAWDTQTTFSVYGGKGCYTDPDVQQAEPKGNYKSGNLLASKTFGEDPKYDQKWYTFGPFNPTAGEYVEQFGGCYILKVVSETISGDDGNLYNYYLSTDPDNNKPIEGGNAFTFCYTFRLWDDPNQVSHIYPYVDDRTIKVTQRNWDWDGDGYIRIVSVVRAGDYAKASGDSEWAESSLSIIDGEKNHSLDIQMIKKKTEPLVKHNNVVMYVLNQRNEALKFYANPIGGVPVYKPKIKSDAE